MVNEFVLSNPDSNMEFLDCFSFSMEENIVQVIKRIVLTKIVVIMINIRKNLMVYKRMQIFFSLLYYIGFFSLFWKF